MIILRGTSPEGEILMLGLSRENVNRLTEGKPIRIRPETHGNGIPQGWTIAIFFGETELEMQTALKKAGAIGPNTKIMIDPRLK